MKKLLFLLLALMPLVVSGQKAKIDFEETSHHFGSIKENDGKVSFHFIFKNTGNTPLILTNVRAGCGCTVPSWSNKPVLPGEKSSIKVTFDPTDRPGSFIKCITVNSNADPRVVSLTVRGNVIKEPKGPYSDYLVKLGNLRMKSNALLFGTIKNTD